MPRQTLRRRDPGDHGLLAKIAGFFVGGGAGLGIGTYVKRRILLRLLRPYVRECLEEIRGRSD